MNVSSFTHPVFPDQIERNVENVRENETVSNTRPNYHRLNKRNALNMTAESNKDSYVIVPSSKKRPVTGNADNRRINVVVHNITSLVSDDSRLVDDIRGGGGTAPRYGIFVQ